MAPPKAPGPRDRGGILILVGFYGLCNGQRFEKERPPPLAASADKDLTSLWHFLDGFIFHAVESGCPLSRARLISAPQKSCRYKLSTNFSRDEFHISLLIEYERIIRSVLMTFENSTSSCVVVLMHKLI